LNSPFINHRKRTSKIRGGVQACWKKKEKKKRGWKGGFKMVGKGTRGGTNEKKKKKKKKKRGGKNQKTRCTKKKTRKENKHNPT